MKGISHLNTKFLLAKYQTYIIMKSQDKSLQPIFEETITLLTKIGLDLFNDDTRPSGHISRPTQVNVSQSCFNSLSKLLKLNYIVQVWGLVEIIVSYQIEESHSSREFHYASLGNCLEEGYQWVSCVVFITTFL